MKILFKNTFHNTEKIISFKRDFSDPDMDLYDALRYRIYSDSQCDDSLYIKRKINEINSLCPHKMNSCACASAIKILNNN